MQKDETAVINTSTLYYRILSTFIVEYWEWDFLIVTRKGQVSSDVRIWIRYYYVYTGKLSGRNAATAVGFGVE